MIGDEGDGEQEGRQSEQHVERPHQDRVGPATEVSGEQPERNAHEQRKKHGADGDAHRRAVGVEYPAQDVAPEGVGAKRVREVGRAEDAVRLDRLRGVRGDHRSEQPDHDEDHDDREPRSGAA